ncbi:hypothetical protein PM082_006143 [Marasmius tenuissimus]|nr:hypothetical protein PM082_006143 [Marasmius tenuissimus]
MVSVRTVLRKLRIRNLSVYQLVFRYAGFWVAFDGFSFKTQRRRRKRSIYLFVLPPPPDFNDYYNISSLHFWSFHEDGQRRLSPKSCRNFGLPSTLWPDYRGFRSSSWSISDYKHLHEYQLSRGFDPKTINFARHLGYGVHIFQPIDDSYQFKEVLKENFGVFDNSNGSVSGDSVDLSNVSDPQPVEDADSWGSLQLRLVQWLREVAPTIRLDDVASITHPGELESGDRRYQSVETERCYPPGSTVHAQGSSSNLTAPLHKDVAASNNIVIDCLQPCSSGSASDCNNGTDSPAGNVTGGADTAPSIHSEVNSVVTTRHDIHNTHNVGGVDISHVSPSGEADSRVHDDGPAVQLTPPPKLIRTSRMRIIAPFASLIPRVSATLRPSLTTAEDLWGSFGSSLSDSGAPAAPRYGQSHLLVSGSPIEDQDGDSTID